MNSWARRRCAILGRSLAFTLLALGYVREAPAAGDRHSYGGIVEPPSAEPAVDETPAISTQEVRELLPDLELRDAPPTALVRAQLGMHIPYQVLGVGAGVELYPSRWLRLAGLYSFGFSPVENNVKASHYAEASLSVAVLSSGTDLPVSLTTHAIPTAPPFVVQALVPAYRTWFVEGGALSGFFAPARCTANCDGMSGQKELVADSRQWLMPFAGVRYVSYYSATSERAKLHQRAYAQVYGHLFMRPFNSPHHPIYSYKGEELDRGSFGGRIGVDYTPPFCVAGAVLHTACAQGGLAIGYNPAPGFVFLEFHVSYLLD